MAMVRATNIAVLIALLKKESDVFLLFTSFSPVYDNLEKLTSISVLSQGFSPTTNTVPLLYARKQLFEVY